MTAFDELLDALDQERDRLNLRKAQSTPRRRQLHQGRESNQRRMSKALSNIRRIGKQVDQITQPSKEDRLRQLYGNAHEELQKSIGHRPAHEIAGMERQLNQVGTLLHRAGLI